MPSLRRIRAALSRHNVRVSEARAFQPNPLVMMFSDARRVHATWLTEVVAAEVLAPTQETLGQALAAGFDPSRLHLVHSPLRNQFYDKQLPTREQVFESINRVREWKLRPQPLHHFSTRRR